MTISADQFAAVEMRVGRITRAEDFPAARRAAHRLWIDSGEAGVRKSSARLARHCQPDTLPGRLVIAVTNFPPRQIADFMSEVLVLGVPDDDGEVVLLVPDQDVPLGGRVY